MNLYETLGSGTFGKVFLLPRHTVIKKAHYHSREAQNQLIRDYEFLQNINKTLGNSLLIRHTKALTITLKPDQEWIQHQHHLALEDQHFTPYFEMQRVGPLPQRLVKKIINLYCPEGQIKQLAIQNSVHHTYIARLYLGKQGERRREQDDPPKRFFSMKNFNITVSRALELGIDVAKIASAMGQLLARLHWVTLTDANDIEICLGTGSAPNYGLSQFQEHQWRLFGVLSSMKNATIRLMHPHNSLPNCNSYTNHSNHAVLQICQVMVFQEKTFIIKSECQNSQTPASWCDNINDETDTILETFEKGEELVVWVIDFDKARPIDPLQPDYDAIVKAHLMNDPYWPVATQNNPLFTLFAKAYREECQHIDSMSTSVKVRKAEERGEVFLKRLISKTEEKKSKNPINDSN